MTIERLLSITAQQSEMLNESDPNPNTKPTVDSHDESSVGFSTDSIRVNRPLSRPRLNIVLVEPEIPNNTGNIGRTCVTTGCKLHLVHPLGFDTDEKACRRAGLDYWPRLDLEDHESLDSYLDAYAPEDETRKGKTWFLTTKATRSFFDAPIAMGDHVVFGRESAGLPGSIHEAHPDSRICVPLVPDERSLNLSTCVAIVVYESVRKMIGNGSLAVNEQGRLVDAPQD